MEFNPTFVLGLLAYAGLICTYCAARYVWGANRNPDEAVRVHQLMHANLQRELKSERGAK